MTSPEGSFKARDISIRAQKKLFGRMANKNMAKVFIDDTSADLLDNVYRLAKARNGSKKEAEKVVKNIIKMVLKIGILYRNDQFNAEELNTAEEFKKKFHMAAMTLISFHDVEFSYDRPYLLTLTRDCSALLKRLVQRLLTDKSLGRIDFVFGFFSEPAFLDEMFNRNNPLYREIMSNIVGDMNRLIDRGDL